MYAFMDVISTIAYMIARRLKSKLNSLLHHSPAVALLGPRQAGKTTLALEIAGQQKSLYLDLEDENDRVKLADPSKYLEDHQDELVVLDEVHRVPEIFQQLRAIIDRDVEGEKPMGVFFSSVRPRWLLRQSGESLAGRIFYLELGPFDVLETGAAAMDTLWVRGGFPRSFLAETDDLSTQWRRDFVRTYLERDIPQFGSRIPAETLRRFWTMPAHNQAQILNAANLARSLAVDARRSPAAGLAQKYREEAG
jgi:predicted AAA+ superfamily ATPase